MKQSSQEGYRDNLAGELKYMRAVGGRSAELAQDLLEESKKTDKYKQAKHLHEQAKTNTRIEKIKEEHFESKKKTAEERLGWKNPEFFSQGVTIRIHDEIYSGVAEELLAEKNKKLASGEHPWRLFKPEDLKNAITAGFVEFGAYLCEGSKVLDGSSVRSMEDYSECYDTPVNVKLLMYREK